MKNILGWKSQLTVALALLVFAISARAEGRDGWICGPDGCFAAIQETQYSGFDAWRLCDGKTEAIIVPALGRVMSFKTESGQNWLWNATFPNGKTPDTSAWHNWGGDKTWLSPQANWAKMGAEKGWPPAREWDQNFQSQVLSGGKLKIWGPVSPVTSLRISRVFYHDANGDFVIEQSVQQEKGAPISAGIWSVTQIDGEELDAVFLARSEKSDYDSGFRQLSKAMNGAQPQTVSPTLLQVIPTLSGDYKIGTDAPRAAIAAVKNGVAFVQRAARPEGNYPDGEAGKSGTPVQLFSAGNAKANYLELEMLSPIFSFKPGARWTHAVRWSLHSLPSEDVNDAKTHAAVEKLLH